jgi:hypothetical protein
MQYSSNSLCVILYDYSLMICNGSNANMTRVHGKVKCSSLSHVSWLVWTFNLFGGDDVRAQTF